MNLLTELNPVSSSSDILLPENGRVCSQTNLRKPRVALCTFSALAATSAVDTVILTSDRGPCIGWFTSLWLSISL